MFESLSFFSVFQTKSGVFFVASILFFVFSFFIPFIHSYSSFCGYIHAYIHLELNSIDSQPKWKKYQMLCIHTQKTKVKYSETERKENNNIERESERERNETNRNKKIETEMNEKHTRTNPHP